MIFLCFMADWYNIMETSLNKAAYSDDIWYLAIIPRARVGYEMIDSQRDA